MIGNGPMLSPPPADVVRDCIARLNVILLIPHGRSGSVLMQSLFDGHPQVAMFPYWHKHVRWRRSASDSAAELVDRFCEQKSLFGGEALKLASNRDEQPSIDVAAFKSAFHAVLEALPAPDDRTLFVAAHLALASLQEKDLAALRYLVVHVHAYAHLDLQTLLAYFPTLRFLAMHRDPREEWVSYRRAYLWEYGEQDLLDKLLEFIEYRLETWNVPLVDFLRACPPGHTRVVDLNRLHGAGEETMRAIAGWLGLDWDERLLRSTILGRPWRGNSFMAVPVNGLEPARAAYTWPSRLPARDVLVLNYFFHSLLDATGYDPPVRPARADVLRAMWRTRPSVFGPRRGSVYLEGREKIDRAFAAEREAPSAAGRLGRLTSRLPLAWHRRAYTARHLVAIWRRGARATLRRYDPRRVRRLEAMAEQASAVRLLDLRI